MGNKLFKYRTEQQTDKNVKEVDTLSIVSEHGVLVEPKMEPLPTPVQACACETALAPACACETLQACVCEIAPAQALACETVPVPIIVTSDIAESLSKSLPIDIPIPEPIVERTSEIVEDNNICETDNNNNNTAEIESLSSISEEDGFKSEPNTEESDLSSDEDVLKLDE
jgi:hypothetical protein